MGYEYRLLNPKNKTWFDLGKGNFARPLREFAKRDSDAPNAASTNWEQLLLDRHAFHRSMMAKDQSEFVQLYVAALQETYDGTMELEYLQGLGNKLWDWLGEDEVWIYGDHAFEVHERSDWRLSGSRYSENCAKCHKPLVNIFELHEGPYQHSSYCEEHYCSTKRLLDSGLVPHRILVTHKIKGEYFRQPRALRPGIDESQYRYQRLIENGWSTRKFDSVEDATFYYKDNKKAIVFALGDLIVFEYYITTYITKERLEEIKRQEEAEYQRKRAHNEKYKDDPKVFQYVFVESYVFESKPVTTWRERNLKKFNVLDRSKERLRQAVEEHELDSLFRARVFIDGEEQK